jgi:hypothetical protein
MNSNKTGAIVNWKIKMGVKKNRDFNLLNPTLMLGLVFNGEKLLNLDCCLNSICYSRINFDYKVDIITLYIHN